MTLQSGKVVTTPASASSSTTTTTNAKRRRRQRRKNSQRTRRTGHIVPISDPVEVAKASEALEKYLRERRCIPEDANDLQRRATLDALEKILCQWSSSLHSIRPISENRWQRPRVTLVTFGSYRLRVHRPDSDLDVLALCPPTCTRADFFTSLVKFLREDVAIKDLHPIPSAFTPVIKFRLNGIQVDMLFGRVAESSKLLQFQQKRPSPLLSTISMDQDRPEYSIDDSDLLGMDEAGVRSLNGARVTQLILEMVPNKNNFRILASAVKEWAVQNGIYSNVLGFLGGVNFAILCAWVCKRHPKQPPASLLRIFFRTFACWQWPTPVILTPVQSDPPVGVPSMLVWNPKVNPRDARHLMPIITPAYPSMNSTYNVGSPQLRRIQEELIRAALVLEEGENHWSDIFQGSDFFERHSNYIQITIRACNSGDFLKWHRLCESRLRILINSLETPQISPWPFAQFFHKKNSNDVGVGENVCVQESYFYVALRFAPGVETVNLRYCTSDFLHKVNSWEERKEGMDLNINHMLQADLPDFVFQKVKAVPFRTMEHLEIPEQPEKRGSKTTGLTPIFARSTLSECHGASPAKRARNEL